MAPACLSNALTSKMLPAQRTVLQKMTAPSPFPRPARPSFARPDGVRLVVTLIMAGGLLPFAADSPEDLYGHWRLKTLAPASGGATGAALVRVNIGEAPMVVNLLLGRLPTPNLSTPRLKDLSAPQPGIARRLTSTGLSRMSRISSRRPMSKSGGR